MKVNDIMTALPIAITARDSVSYAAELMRLEKIGSIPVVNDLAQLNLVGIITDRDIAVRCVALGHDAKCNVGTHMTEAPLQTVTPDDDVSAVIEQMENAQVRRIPVVSGNHTLVGIVAQADLARKIGPTDPRVVEEVLQRVSEPLVGEHDVWSGPFAH